MKNELLTALQGINELSEVPEEQLTWFIDNAEEVHYKIGDYLFRKGDPIDRLFIVLEGRFDIKIEQNGQYRMAGMIEPNSISGYLPYSRAKSATGNSMATQAGRVLALHKNKFKHMINAHEQLTTAFVHVMSTRIRNFTKLQQQNDKMMALGKLSAGLAHELNNPSAAVVRSARSLKKHLSFLPEHFKRVISTEMEPALVDAVNGILFQKVEEGVKQIPLSEKAEREDNIAEWLEENGFDDGYELADNLVDYDFAVDDLEIIKKHVNNEDDLVPVLNWLCQVLITEKLVNEIEDASKRINDLVLSVKSYTHMDQAPEKKETDIREGIDNTLTMLQHKLKKGNIEVAKNYADLPNVPIFVSEMNQVWTNLIDNAIDALSNSTDKKLEINTIKEGDYAHIYVVDHGSGIPEEIQGQIFDPFFTTKDIGKGTGLGLDVVRQIITQHKGTITVKSVPGRTEFKVCLPFN